MASTADTIDRGHPIERAVAVFEAELDRLVGQSTWSLDAEQSRDLLVRLTRSGSRLAELETRVADQARAVEVEAESGATSTANWWAHATRQTRSAAHRKTRLSAALGSESYESVRVAMAEGALLVDQAEVIIAAVDALPAGLVDEPLRAEAMATLIAHAAEHDAKALRVLGRRVLDVLAPEVGEAHEALLLEEQEREAEAAAAFRMHDDGHGKSHGQFTVPTGIGQMLRKALLAIAAPKHRASVDRQAPEPGRPTARRMGQSLCEYVAGYPAEQLPDAGGVAATVVVTMDLDSLLGGLKAAQLDTGARVSASLARRWACQAGIIPAVLGTQSQVLDLGRKTRFHTQTQRIALGLEQGGCTADGCDWPPGMCHAHHDTPWHQGGGTSVKTGRLLCPRHHARAHDPTYTRTLLSGGKVAFHRRM